MEIANPKQFNYIALTLGVFFLTFFVGIVLTGFCMRHYTISEKKKRQQQRQLRENDENMLYPPDQNDGPTTSDRDFTGRSNLLISAQLDNYFAEDLEGEEGLNQFTLGMYNFRSCCVGSSTVPQFDR